MKTFLFGVCLFVISLILCVTLALSQVAMNIVGVGGGVPAAGGLSCTSPALYDSYTTTADTGQAVRYNDTVCHVGQGLYDPGATRNLCGMDFYAYAVNGNISSYIFTISIYSLKDTDDLDQLLNSCTLAGSAISVGNWFGCTFSTYNTISSGTTYGLTVTSNTASTDNNVVLGARDSGTGMSGQFYYWGDCSTKIGTANGTKETNIKLYEAQ